MSSKKFWKLSLYEWSLWLARIGSLQDKRRQDHELLIELERNRMAQFANANFKPPAGKQFFTGSDYYKLSYDTVDNTTPAEDEREAIEATVKRLEAIARKKIKNGTKGNR